MKRIAPGVYDDGQGGLHLDVAELLAAAGYPDTPNNRAMILEAARDTFGATVTETDDPIERPSYRCPRCGFVSYSPQDLANRYCIRCHQFETP